MSTSPDPARPKTSAFGRYMFVLLLGLVLGAVATVMMMNAWMARKDHFHGSVMHVQNWHLKQLENKAKENRCAATDTIPHLKALRTMADDIEPAFPDLRDDQRFVGHASAIRATLDAALSAPPLNCDGVGTVVKKIDENCGACHQEFKG